MDMGYRSTNNKILGTFLPNIHGWAKKIPANKKV